VFVHGLRRRGIGKSGADDGGWSAVDEAWRAPPETTEQLLHLDKYDAKERPEDVPVPRAPGPGWETAYDDVFGEEGLRIALEEWMPARTAASVARGWGGDRAVLFRQVGAKPDANGVTGAQPGGQPTPVPRTPGALLAAAWLIRFDRGDKDPDMEAREAFKALAQSDAFKPRSGSARPPGATPCIERTALGPVSMTRAGRDLLLLAGPYRRDGNRVASDSLCAKSLRWAADILGKDRR
jgi:hypothetical protein